MTFIIGGFMSSNAEPRPLVPLHLNCLYCLSLLSVLLKALMLVTWPARRGDFALNGRQGPHPPFHSPHQFRIPQLL